LETAIFRIVQEALTNVSHAASVALAKANGEVRIKVRDDGKGIANQVENFRPGSVGVGVSGMRQRVSEFGGELRLSNAHPGTLVEVIIPVQSVAPDEKSFRAAAFKSP
jgi:two-component system, NarL family, sensor kinase